MAARLLYAAMRTIHTGVHMPMHNPPRLGEYLLEDALPAPGLAVASLAKRIDGPPRSLSTVMLCHAPVSHELDAQLELAVPGRASHWLAQQAAYDLWQAQQKSPQK
jgi:addiction module HigA family antidote